MVYQVSNILLHRAGCVVIKRDEIQTLLTLLLKNPLPMLMCDYGRIGSESSSVTANQI